MGAMVARRVAPPAGECLDQDVARDARAIRIGEERRDVRSIVRAPHGSHAVRSHARSSSGGGVKKATATRGPQGLVGSHYDLRTVRADDPRRADPRDSWT